MVIKLKGFAGWVRERKMDQQTINTIVVIDPQIDQRKIYARTKVYQNDGTRIKMEPQEESKARNPWTNQFRQMIRNVLPPKN